MRSVCRRPFGIAALLLSACTTTFDIPVTRVEHPAVHKFDLRVELRLSDAFRNARWEYTYLGDTEIMPLGELLAENAEILARALFSSVTISHSASERSTKGIQAVLEPTVVRIERDQPIYRNEKQTTLVILKWKLANPAGNTIWVETVKGEGVGPLVTGFASREGGAQKQAEALAKDLFDKSFEVISSAAEIRAFAASLTTGAAAPFGGMRICLSPLVPF